MLKIHKIQTKQVEQRQREKEEKRERVEDNDDDDDDIDIGGDDNSEMESRMTAKQI